MQLHFYKTVSERNRVDKVLTDEIIKTGIVSNEFDILSPTFTVTNFDVTSFNYIYAPYLHRYYFIDGVRVINNNLFEIQATIDVLMTYANEIRNSYGKAIKTENSNPYYGDYDQPIDVRQTRTVYTFENNFNEDGQIVLVAMANG